MEPEIITRMDSKTGDTRSVRRDIVHIAHIPSPYTLDWSADGVNQARIHTTVTGHQIAKSQSPQTSTQTSVFNTT